MFQKNDVVVFDFDDTLADTSFLRDKRENEQWEFIKSQVHKVQLYNGIEALINKLTQIGVQIHICSSSPKWYVESILSNHPIPMSLVNIHAPFSKSNYFGVDLLRKIKRSKSDDRIFIVGDRCVDIGLANLIENKIAALWGAKHIPDLHLAYPDFIAERPLEIVNNLKKFDLINLNWRKIDKNHDSRTFLSSRYGEDLHDIVSFCRIKRDKENCFTNRLVNDFKFNKFEEKKFACNRFANELLMHLVSKYPNQIINIIFVQPSNPENQRWQFFTEYIKRNALYWKGIYFPNLIKTKSASQSLHLVAAEERDPSKIKENLDWNKPELEKIVKLYKKIHQTVKLIVVDDVLTKGTSVRAYYEFISAELNAQELKFDIEFCAWSLFTSKNHYECNYR
jgi:phosphoglycolate phosphatase-like HAD superfamily hydrolase/predicted amidophosphoribosyltransferase